MTSYEIPKCLIIDARDHILGRLASTVAKHLLMGTKIYILRCERIVMAGHMIRSTLKFRSYFRHRMSSNPKKRTLSLSCTITYILSYCSWYVKTFNCTWTKLYENVTLL